MVGQRESRCPPLEIEQPRNWSRILPLRLLQEAGYVHCAHPGVADDPACLCWGLTFLGLERQREKQHGEQVQAQIPSLSAFFSQSLLCHSPPMWGVFAMPFPQEITGLGW